jgi:hypothetical protein
MFLKTTTMCKLTFKPFKSQEELLWIFKVINIQSWPKFTEDCNDMRNESQQTSGGSKVR